MNDPDSPLETPRPESPDSNPYWPPPEPGSGSDQTREPKPAPAQRLGILHLMIWMTVTALLFWQSQLTLDSQSVTGSSFNDGIQKLQLITFAISSVVGGAVFAAFYALIQGWRSSAPPGHRGRLMRHPGYWLVLSFSLFSTLRFMTSLATLGLPSLRGETNWQMGIFIFALLPTVLIFFVAAFHCEERRWRLLFASMGLFSLLSIVNLGLVVQGTDMTTGSTFHMLNSVARLFGIIIPLVLILVALGERLRGRRRDWIHWVGIASEASTLITSLIWMVGMRFIN